MSVYRIRKLRPSEVKKLFHNFDRKIDEAAFNATKGAPELFDTVRSYILARLRQGEGDIKTLSKEVKSLVSQDEEAIRSGVLSAPDPLPEPLKNRIYHLAQQRPQTPSLHRLFGQEERVYFAISVKKSEVKPRVQKFLKDQGYTLTNEGYIHNLATPKESGHVRRIGKILTEVIEECENTIKELSLQQEELEYSIKNHEAVQKRELDELINIKNKEDKVQKFENIIAYDKKAS